MSERIKILEKAYRYLQQRLESIGYNGWAHDMDGEIEAAGVIQSETACRDAERWQFCMEHGFPKACYNPEQQVNYFYVRGDCCDDTAFGWDSPEEAVDATMQIIKERERESRTTRR